MRKTLVLAAAIAGFFVFSLTAPNFALVDSAHAAAKNSNGGCKAGDSNCCQALSRSRGGGRNVGRKPGGIYSQCMAGTYRE